MKRERKIEDEEGEWNENVKKERCPPVSPVSPAKSVLPSLSLSINLFLSLYWFLLKA